jgi:hypothetical protein
VTTIHAVDTSHGDSLQRGNGAFLGAPRFTDKNPLGVRLQCRFTYGTLGLCSLTKSMS